MTEIGKEAPAPQPADIVAEDPTMDIK